MLNLCVSALSSNSGKTILTTALLHHFRGRVRPFKIGPDYIDPQFHQKVSGTPSVNLDSFIMEESQVKWLYAHYSDKEVSIVEGVMGFYDGEDRGCSAHTITKLLNIPTLLILDGAGSYITISAILYGMKSYREGNTIKGVVLNNLSSPSHFALIRDHIAAEHPDITVLGWIRKELPSLGSTHLGLDLNDLEKIRLVSEEVLEHIDLSLLERFAMSDLPVCPSPYPFKKLAKQKRHLAIVYDENFSFLYHDNLRFLEELFEKVTIVQSTRDEPIPKSADTVYICGGYVETPEAYGRIRDSNAFRESLIRHARSRKVYAECAGLLYLGNRVDEKAMSGILDVDFTLQERFTRLGYYYNEAGTKGHSFHYTKPVDDRNGFDILSKKPGGSGAPGSWKNREGNVFGTYLHTMFRNNRALIEKYFI